MNHFQINGHGYCLQMIQIIGAESLEGNIESVEMPLNVDYVRFKDTIFTEKIFSNRMKTLTVYGRVNLNTFAGRTTTQVFIDDYDLEYNQEDSHKYDFF